MDLYRRCLRPVLFGFDAERAHHATLNVCRAIGRSALVLRGLDACFRFKDVRLKTKVGGIEFANPVGLPAGFDKNGVAVPFLTGLGFGFVEIGSVSALSSQGNPVRPRLFRLPADECLMVYYGVPNIGAEMVAEGLPAQPHPTPLGVSLVETNTGAASRVDAVIAELTQAARRFVGIADYLALNLNCPNSSEGFSHFDQPSNLKQLLESCRHIAGLPPVYLKLAPAHEPARIDAVLEAVDPFAFVKGFILNTLAKKPYAGLRTPEAQLARMPGTLTGAALRQPASEAIRMWYRRIDRSRHALIGVGGIASGRDAYEMIRAGASLVQILTALVYHGPGLVKQIKQQLAHLLDQDGIASVADAVGADNIVRAAAH
jgi:dihydroorotate dehydrogenase